MSYETIRKKPLSLEEIEIKENKERINSLENKVFELWEILEENFDNLTPKAQTHFIVETDIEDDNG